MEFLLHSFYLKNAEMKNFFIQKSCNKALRGIMLGVMLKWQQTQLLPTLIGTTKSSSCVINCGRTATCCRQDWNLITTRTVARERFNPAPIQTIFYISFKVCILSMTDYLTLGEKKKKKYVFQVSWPCLGFCPDPKLFIVNFKENSPICWKWGKMQYL